MTDILRFLPPEAQLAISLDQYRNFIEIAQRLERDRIIELLNTAYDFYAAISDAAFKLPDGNDVLEVNDAHAAFNAYQARLLELIKGEQK